MLYKFLFCVISNKMNILLLQMQTNAVEEIANSRHNTAPEDMLSVILVLPDQQELNKTFSKDTLSEV